MSIDENDLSEEAIKEGQRAFRSILIDEASFEFSQGFTDLHTVCYQHILEGAGFGLESSRKAIEVVHEIRTAFINNNFEKSLLFSSMNAK